MDLSVVVPIKDERDNIGPLHERLRRALDPLGLHYEIVLVDDGSVDGSYAQIYKKWFLAEAPALPAQ